MNSLIIFIVISSAKKMLSLSGLQFSLQQGDPGGCINTISSSTIAKKTTTYLNMLEAAAKRTKVVGCFVSKTKMSVVFEDRTCAQLRYSGQSFTDCIVYSNKALGSGKSTLTTVLYDNSNTVYSLATDGILRRSVLDFANTNRSTLQSAIKLPEQITSSQGHGILSSESSIIVLGTNPPAICFLRAPEQQPSQKASDKSSDRSSVVSVQRELILSKIVEEIPHVIGKIHAWSWVGQDTMQIRVLADASLAAQGAAVTMLTISTRDGSLEEKHTFQAPSAVTVCGANRMGDVWCFSTESNHLVAKSSYSRTPTIRQPASMQTHLGAPSCVKVTQTLIFVGLCSSYTLMFDYGLNPITVISGLHSISTFGVNLTVPSVALIQNLDSSVKSPFDTSETIAVFGTVGPVLVLSLEGALTHQSIFAQIAVQEHKLQYLRAIGNSTILKSLVGQSLCDSYSQDNYSFPLKLLDVIPVGYEGGYSPMFKPLFVNLIDKRSYLQAYKLAGHFNETGWFDILHRVLRETHSELSSLCLLKGSSTMREDVLTSAVIMKSTPRDEYSERAMSDLLELCESPSPPQLDLPTITILSRLVALYKSPTESINLLNKFVQQAANEGRDDEAAELKAIVEKNSELLPMFTV